MHHPTDRIAHNMTFIIPVLEHWLEREIAQLVHHKGPIRQPIAPCANALTTSYISLLSKRLFSSLQIRYLRGTMSKKKLMDPEFCGAFVFITNHILVRAYDVS